MGAGRKKRTTPLKVKEPPKMTINCSISARNIGKKALGGVIFGATNYTFKECIDKKLFGLPYSHYSYVKNVSIGMPLFLFNYSKRKLHGIFEAASNGQLNIDPYGWAIDGSETRYPAQVCIKTRVECKPLTEDQFKPIIADNYYEHNLFWFELDKTQTSRLISLFSSAPAIQNASSRQTPSKSLSAISTQGVGDSIHYGENLSNQKFETAINKDMLGMHGNVGTSFPPKTWDSLFKPQRYGIGNVDGSSHIPAVEVIKSCKDHISIACTVDNDTTNWEDRVDGHNDSIVSKTNSEQEKLASIEHESSWSLDNVIPNWEDPVGVQNHYEVSCFGPHSEQCDHLDHEDRLGDQNDSKVSNCEEETLAVQIEDHISIEHEFSWSLDNDIENWEDPVDDKSDSKVYSFGPHSERRDYPGQEATNPHPQKHLCEESQLGPLCKNASNVLVESSGTQSLVSECSNNFVVTEGCELKNNSDEDSLVSAESAKSAFVEEMLQVLKSSDIQLVVAELVREIGNLKLSQFRQTQKINTLEHELVQSRAEIQMLKNSIEITESGSTPAFGHDEGESQKSLLEPELPIFLVGGYDGRSWLSSLISYSPSQDFIKFLNPMSSVRSYASAAKLDGQLYVFGGGDGTLWYDTVEAYNPANDQWVECPLLNKKRGSLAGASLHSRIYAIGGGNGVDCFSDVEVLDLDVGHWVTSSSMLQKRFSPSASEIDGALYVVGGYDGHEYLKSFERFDAREHSWTRLESMSIERGCHSVAVLNGKLYALGGFNGRRMVSTVEMFDPRMGSWVFAESMNIPRGYTGAVTVGNSIYVMGGMQDNGEVLDTVERFSEDGRGWEVIKTQSLGKRCFFSAMVI